MPAPARVPRPVTAVLVVLALVAATVVGVRLLRPREDMVVLGDSLTFAAKDQLVAAGHDAGYSMSVDGIPGIRLASRMMNIAALGHHSSGPVVIELGTNDVDSGVDGTELASRIDQAVTFLAAVPCVVFVGLGILLDNDGRAHGFNEHLAAVAEAHPNMHVFDWETEYRQHPDWSLDSVHLKPEFVPYYAHGIVDTVKKDC
ncbi:MAG TPA: GDSL-type esterase/lipase family protein [Acidimicrobiales bacterium]|nr:GDSL-type esterase/lipase family protein [Acidimicrobiales bacterium]